VQRVCANAHGFVGAGAAHGGGAVRVLRAAALALIAERLQALSADVASLKAAMSVDLTSPSQVGEVTLRSVPMTSR